MVIVFTHNEYKFNVFEDDKDREINITKYIIRESMKKTYF